MTVIEPNSPWILFPEAGAHIINYAGCCMLDQANPDTANADTVAMTNSANGPGAAIPVSNGPEQRLAVKFEFPFITAPDGQTRLFIGTDNDIHWEFTTDPSIGVFLFGWRIFFITVNFEYTGAGCATWNSLNCAYTGFGLAPSTDAVQPKTTGASDLSYFDRAFDADELGGAMAFDDDPGLTGNSNPQCCAILQPAEDTTVYGLMVFHSGWIMNMIGTNLQNVSCTTTLWSPSRGTVAIVRD